MARERQGKTEEGKDEELREDGTNSVLMGYYDTTNKLSLALFDSKISKLNFGKALSSYCGCMDRSCVGLNL